MRSASEQSRNWRAGATEHSSSCVHWCDGNWDSNFIVGTDVRKAKQRACQNTRALNKGVPNHVSESRHDFLDVLDFWIPGLSRKEMSRLFETKRSDQWPMVFEAVHCLAFSALLPFSCAPSQHTVLRFDVFSFAPPCSSQFWVATATCLW